MNKYMKIAIEEAEEGVNKNHGGPFGAVIVKNGKLLARAHNTVLISNDPTAHAEINAIRSACKNIESFDLSGCEIYSTSEPCPMCFAAVLWARIEKLYYGCTKEDCEKIGFDDNTFYDVLKDMKNQKILHINILDRDECLKTFKLWESKKDKTMY